MKENWSPELTASMVAKYPELSQSESMDIFKRKWEYMFVYCEVGFLCIVRCLKNDNIYEELSMP